MSVTATKTDTIQSVLDRAKPGEWESAAQLAKLGSAGIAMCDVRLQPTG